MIQQTSLLAYQGLQKALGERQALVLSLFRTHLRLYDQQIAKLLGWPINSTTPRRNELEHLGLIRRCGTTISEFTGSTVGVYELV